MGLDIHKYNLIMTRYEEDTYDKDNVPHLYNFPHNGSCFTNVDRVETHYCRNPFNDSAKRDELFKKCYGSLDSCLIILTQNHNHILEELIKITQNDELKKMYPIEDWQIIEIDW